MKSQIEIKTARSSADFLVAKELILEYTKWLAFDLAFQQIDKELDNLPQMYGGPDGGLVFASINGKAVGVAGIRKYTEKECELKRMYVKPESRGLGVGKLLLTACIEIAKERNYDVVKLDTTNTMKSAIKLYTDKGFIEIPAYRYNPQEGARYFELSISRL